jgi:transcriptional regulator with XRE-family HTH domain
MGQTPLAEFLRARRALLQPEEVGLVDGRPRRVAGLRRDELADLAGISPEYYTRLEQGRDRHPSEQVLDALARALRLADHERIHLHHLARPDAVQFGSRTSRSVPAGLEELVESWGHTPAVVMDHRFRTLASNELARALAPRFALGADALRDMFLDPSVRELYREGWREIAANCVAGLRANAGPDVADPEIRSFVGELCTSSPDFKEFWERHEARPPAGDGYQRLYHPVVGKLELRFFKFAVVGAERCSLSVYRADGGSVSERRLQQLQLTLRAA